jgi:hypothetical protein
MAETHRERHQGLAVPLAAVLSIVAILLTLTAGPADYTFINGAPTFCARTVASVNTDTAHTVASATLSATRNGSSCTSELAWPAGLIATRTIYWDSPYPYAHICAQQNSYSYNPDFTNNYSDAFQALIVTPCHEPGHAATSSDSWVFVYPNGWVNGTTLTPFVATNP